MSQTILVVDDDIVLAELVEEVLSDEGYVVHVVHNGASALFALIRYNPDLMIMDIMMPVMTGDQVLQTMQASSAPHPPVIVSTANAHPQQYLALGAASVLPKPYGLDQLLSTVAACLV